MKPLISIIIPTFHEETALANCLSDLSKNEGPIEIIVSDANSTDSTVAIAKSFPGVKVLQSKRCRATQMNLGAKNAKGEIFWFLHADSRISSESTREIRNVLKDSSVNAGVFQFAIDSVYPIYRVLEFGVCLRSNLLKLPYGDQGLFMKSETFSRIGRFPEIPLMEDVEMIRKLKLFGKIKILSVPLKTSPRRWENSGILRTTFCNIACLILYKIGVSAFRLINFREMINKCR